MTSISLEPNIAKTAGDAI